MFTGVITYSLSIVGMFIGFVTRLCNIIIVFTEVVTLSPIVVNMLNVFITRLRSVVDCYLKIDALHIRIASKPSLLGPTAMYHSIVHLSDIHIRSGDSKRSRYQEYSDVFANLLDSIRAQPAIIDRTALIVITGDLFHHKNRIEPYGLELAIRLVTDLAQLAPVVIIRGNHDYRQDVPEERDTITAMMNYQIPNVHYFDSTGIHTIGNIHFGVTAVQDTLLYGATSGISSQLPPFPTPPRLAPDTYSVALFHGSVISSTLQNGAPLTPTLHGYPIDWFGKDYDAILLGDIHLQQVKRAKCIDEKEPELPQTTRCRSYHYEAGAAPWAYPGSLIQQDFGETLYGHGYLLWNLRDREIHSYHVWNPRGFIKVRMNDGKVEVLHREISNMAPTYVAADALLATAWFPKHLEIQYTGKDCDAQTLRAVREYFLSMSREVVRMVRPPEPVEQAAGASVAPSDGVREKINSLDVLIEYIQNALEKNKKNVPDLWKQWLQHPERLAMNVSRLPDKMAKKVSERSDKLLKFASSYLEDFERAKTHQGQSESLRLNKLEWDWILCYKDGNVFDFDKDSQQLSILNAKNGHGKSNFLEVIAIALYGEGFPSRFNKNYSSNAICDKKPASALPGTLLTFTLGTTRYRLKRTLKPQYEKRSMTFHEVILYSVSANGECSILHQGQTAVSQWVETHIGTIQAYLMTAMLSQNADCDFFSLDKLKQRTLLDQVLSLEHIQSLQVLLKEAAKYYKHTIDVVEAYYDGIAAQRPVVDRTAELLELRSQADALAMEVDGNHKRWHHVSESRLLHVKSLESLTAELDQVVARASTMKPVDGRIEDLRTALEHATSERDEVRRFEKHVAQYSGLHRMDVAASDLILLNVGEGDGVDLLDSLVGHLETVRTMLLRHPDFTPKRMMEEINEVCAIASSEEFVFNDPEDPDEGQRHVMEIYQTLPERTERMTAFRAWSEHMRSNFAQDRDEFKRERINERVREAEESERIVREYPDMIAEKKKAASKIKAQVTRTRNQLDGMNETRPNRPSLSAAALEDLRRSVGEGDLKQAEERLERTREAIQCLPTLFHRHALLQSKRSDILSYLQECATMPFNPECGACRQQPWRTKYDAMRDQLPAIEEEIHAVMVEVKAWVSDMDGWGPGQEEKAALQGLREEARRLEQEVNDRRQVETETALHVAYDAWAVGYEKVKRDHDRYQGQLNDRMREIERDQALLQSRMLDAQEMRAEVERLRKRRAEYEMYQVELREREKLYDEDDANLGILWVLLLAEYRRTVALLTDRWETRTAKVTEAYKVALARVHEKEEHRALVEKAEATREVIAAYSAWMNWKDAKERERRVLLAIRDIEASSRMSAVGGDGSGSRDEAHEVLQDAKSHLAIVSAICDTFDGYREWLYCQHIAPIIQTRVNHVLRMICDERILLLDSEWLSAIDTLSWFIHDGSSRVIIEKASGFQRFIVGIAIRVAFHQIGFCRVSFDQHFIDEGFTTCDADNIEKVPQFLQQLLHYYRSIYLVTHLEDLKTCTTHHIHITRDASGLSQIQYGDVDVAAPQEKKRGRPPKVKSVGVVVNKV